MSDSPKPKYRAPALEKGLAVLELLARANGPMSLNAISRSLNRSVSELFRMIQVLEFHGYLELASSGEGYVLSNKLFALGMTRAPTRDLHDAALPVMHRLAERIGQSCHLGVVSADQMVIVARVEAPGDLGFSVRIGYRRALVDSTSGLVLYAFQTELVRAEWKKRLASRHKPPRLGGFRTPRTRGAQSRLCHHREPRGAGCHRSFGPRDPVGRRRRSAHRPLRQDVAGTLGSGHRRPPGRSGARDRKPTGRRQPLG